MFGLFRDIQLTAEAVMPHSRPDDYDKQCLEADMAVLVACLTFRHRASSI